MRTLCLRFYQTFIKNYITRFKELHFYKKIIASILLNHFSKRFGKELVPSSV